MTNDNNLKNGKPSVEDKQHLDVLSKEINERLDEFSSIIFKSLGKETGSTLSKVSFERSEKGIRAAAEVIVDDPDNEMTLGYYCDPPGVCQTTPCG